MMLADAKRYLHTFFNPNFMTQDLLDQIQEQREKIKELKEEYEALSEWNFQYIATLGSLTDAMNALVWRKDQRFRYIISNLLHCQIYFGCKENQEEFAKFIIGKRDEQIFAYIKENYDVDSSFSRTCCKADGFVRKSKDMVHFLEAGKVDGNEILLYTIKSAEFRDGKFKGIIGASWDMTPQSDFLIEQLNRWIYAKKATKIYHELDVFSYAITPDVQKCEIFNHICPNPERGKACQGDCDMCKDRGINLTI